MKYLLFFTFSFFLYSSGNSQGIETDWDKTSWGITQLDLRKQYPDIKSFKATREYSIEGKSYVCRSIIPNVSIGENINFSWSMDVNFLMEKEMLAAVQLESSQWVTGKSRFEEIKAFLVTKYSLPISEKILKGEGAFPVTRNIVYWRTKNSKITLMNLSIPDQGLYRTSITFQKP